MSTRSDRDAAIDRLLRTSRGGGSLGADTECPSADVLAAFVEGSLASAEREAAEAHLATCERCHGALAALSEMPEVRPIPARKTRSARPLRWLLPAAAVLTMLIVYVAIKPREQRLSISTQNSITSAPKAARQGEVTPTESAKPASSVVARADMPPATPEAGAGVTRKQDARLEASEPLGTAPPAKLVAGNAPRPDAVAPSQPARADARVAPAAPAPAPPAAADALEMKAALPTAAPQMADAAGGVRPAPTPAPQQFAAGKAADAKAGAMARTIAAAKPPAEVKEQRIDAVAESVAVVAEGSGFVVTSRDGRAQWRIEPRGVVSRSTDSGSTWRPAQIGIATSFLAAASPTATIAWIVGLNGTVVRTVDGEHWTRCNIPEAVDLVAVDAKDDRSAIVVARDGRRFTTADGGTTWAPAR